MKKMNSNNNSKSNYPNSALNKGKTPITKSKSLKGPLVKANNTNEAKSQLKKEIEEKKLPLVDKHYTKDIIDIDIKIDDYALSNTSNKETNNTASTKPPIHQLKSKQEDEIIKKSIGKIEKMYTTCLKNTESIKLSPSASTEELLKQEVIYLKTKNEVLRLKGEFFENIFYTSKNIIETYQIQSDLKEKLIGVFTQNNQHYYESFNFLNKKHFDIFSIEKCTDNDQLINKKCLNVLNAIEENLLSILKDIQSFIKVKGIDNKDPISSLFLDSSSLSSLSVIFKLKDNIISSTKKILSYYALSDNYSFDFKERHSFWINNTDDFIKHDSDKRTTKLVDEFKTLIDPLLNKVMNKKNKTEMVKHIASLCSFYENFNQLLHNENGHLKCFNSLTLQKLNSKNDRMQKAVDEFISLSKEPFGKLTEVIDFLINNQSKNIEKVIYSLMNTQKDSIKNMIFSYNYFIEQYMLIR